jgi:DNA polymerase kappa
MDAFYAAVEMRDNPSLKDKPMAVGGQAMLVCVFFVKLLEVIVFSQSTSNYAARKYGVRAAMPGFIAKKLCPELVIVHTNFDKYRKVSAEVRDIMFEYDPNLCPMSLDEAYLDFTQHLEDRKHFDEERRTFVGPDGEKSVFGISAEEAVNEMRFRIFLKTQLTASAGRLGLWCVFLFYPFMFLVSIRNCSKHDVSKSVLRFQQAQWAAYDSIHSRCCDGLCF